MSLAEAARSVLFVVDFQSRLMPAIADASGAVTNAKRLIDLAALLGVPIVYTEQNPRGLGPTIPELAPTTAGARVYEKMTFDGWRVPAIRAAVPEGAEIVAAGCETHVCLLQTVLGMRADGRVVKVVRDAVGSRRTESRDAALARMERHGAELVTTEMVAFEWLGTAEHPRLKDVLALVK